MAFVRTFTGVTPTRRYDGIPFASAEIRESDAEVGTYATIESFALSPVDADPTDPAPRNFTTALAVEEDGWYVIRWIDGSAATFDSDPVQYLDTAALVTIAELTDFVEAAGLTPSVEDVTEARDLASARIEDACGVAFTPRTASQSLTALNGKGLLNHPLVIRVLTDNGDAVDTGPYGSGEIPLEGGDHDITYTHGYETCPLPIKRAVKLLARLHLTEDPTDLDLRATSKSNELATWSLVTPGMRGAKFPIPEVNQIVSDYTWPGGIF